MSLFSNPGGNAVWRGFFEQARQKMQEHEKMRVRQMEIDLECQRLRQRAEKADAMRAQAYDIWAEDTVRYMGLDPAAGVDQACSMVVNVSKSDKLTVEKVQEVTRRIKQQLMDNVPLEYAYQQALLGIVKEATIVANTNAPPAFTRETRRHIDALRQLLDTQAATCDCDTDSYFRGMYNGLELALATLENREPVYKPVPPAAAAVPADPEPPASTALPANANLLKVR